MGAYFDRSNTRVVIATAVADISAPTLAEIAAGVDVTQLLLPDGLLLPHETVTVDRTPWSGDIQVEVPVRSTMRIELRAYRDNVSASDLVWSNAAFRAVRFLIIRRGIRATVAFAAGQVVETYEARVGRRSNFGGGATTVSVPMFPRDMDDSAVVAA